MKTRKKYPTTTLKEQFASELGFQRQSPALNSMDITTSVLEPWMNEPNSELMAIVSMLKGINTLAQSSHWKTSGESFMSDHGLFQKVYEGVVPQIDMVGEKAVGLGSKTLASPIKVSKASLAFVERIFENQSIVQGSKNEADAMFRRLGYAESMFIETTEKFMSDLDKKGSLTKGLDNLLAGILDTHETFLYLIKQRTEQSF
jgi:DNA-binding ferritin-like protein